MPSPKAIDKRCHRKHHNDSYQRVPIMDGNEAQEQGGQDYQCVMPNEISEIHRRLLPGMQRTGRIPCLALAGVKETRDIQGNEVVSERYPTPPQVPPHFRLGNAEVSEKSGALPAKARGRRAGRMALIIFSRALSLMKNGRSKPPYSSCKL